MKRWWPWLGGMLVGVCLLAAGGIFAGTVGRQLFVTDTGTLTYYPTSEANAFKLCDSLAESNCHLFFVHPTDGLRYKGKCSGATCDTTIQVESGKQFDLKYGTASLITMLPGSNDLKLTSSGWLSPRTGTGAPSSIDCDAAPKYGRVYIQSDAADASMWWVCKSTGWKQQTGGGGGSSEPIRPSSTVPATAGLTFPCIIDGTEMLCYPDATTLNADATWQVDFQMPQALATGCTYKLLVYFKALGTPGTQVISLRPEWNTWAIGATRASLTLNSETVTPDSVAGNAGSGDTIGLTSADANQLLSAKWTLNASTVTAAQPIAMNLITVNATHTLAVDYGMLPSIICE